MTSRRLLLEICAATVDDCLAAEAGGADRIELNAALELGGLTPSVGLLEEVKASVGIPVIAMVRPRPGGFCYSDASFRTMRRDVDALRSHGADGIAFGILRADGSVDVERCRALIEQAAGGAIVFHRAFDVASDPEAALRDLPALGVDRVLTSGRAARAADGAGRIARWRAATEGRIEWIPGSGIRPDNVAGLLRRTGCTQVHASLSGWREDATDTGGHGVSFAPPGVPGPGRFGGTDVDLVREMRRRLDTLAASGS